MASASALPVRRRARSKLMMGLSVGSAGLGLTMLAIILGTLLYKGVAGLNLAVFTEMTPPPGESGGLLNAIFGSVVMTVIGIVIGTPISILAGTYLAEYGRYRRLAHVVRFINDILLSAPSIVVGLFVYEILVTTLGHSPAIAGSLALAILVIPIVVRTTEDMLRWCPDTLREAAASVGTAALADDRLDRLSRRADRHHHRRAAGRRAHLRRDRAAAVHQALNNQFWSHQPRMRRWPDLPVVIFQFAHSAPMRTGSSSPGPARLLITLSVLTLSVLPACSLQRRRSDERPKPTSTPSATRACQGKGFDPAT
jgi:phosphate transport system permease protein